MRDIRKAWAILLALIRGVRVAAATFTAAVLVASDLLTHARSRWHCRRAPVAEAAPQPATATAEQVREQTA